MDAGARASMLPSGEEPASAGSLLAAPHCCLGGTLRGFVLLGGGISPMAAERGKRKLGCSDTGLERDARLSPGALRAIRVLPQGCASCGGRLFPPPWVAASVHRRRSEEHTSELQSLR